MYVLGPDRCGIGLDMTKGPGVILVVVGILINLIWQDMNGQNKEIWKSTISISLLAS